MIHRHMLFEGHQGRRPQRSKGLPHNQPTHPRIQQRHHVQLLQAGTALTRTGGSREEHLVPPELEQLHTRPVRLIPVHRTPGLQPRQTARLGPLGVTPGYRSLDQLIRVAHVSSEGSMPTTWYVTCWVFTWTCVRAGSWPSSSATAFRMLTRTSWLRGLVPAAIFSAASWYS